jgi:hypothetical protein
MKGSETMHCPSIWDIKEYIDVGCMTNIQPPDAAHASIII